MLKKFPKYFKKKSKKWPKEINKKKTGGITKGYFKKYENIYFSMEFAEKEEIS